MRMHGSFIHLLIFSEGIAVVTLIDIPNYPSGSFVKVKQNIQAAQPFFFLFFFQPLAHGVSLSSCQSQLKVTQT